MQARSALFDLYGDHLRPRGGRAPVAALVRLLAPARTSPPPPSAPPSPGWSGRAGCARSGSPAGPGYQLTVRRPCTASTRRPPGSTAPARPSWDGRFDLVVLDAATRPTRTGSGSDRRTSAYLGYGTTRRGAPGSRPAPPTRSTRCSTEAGVRFERFTAAHAAGTPARPRWSAGPGTWTAIGRRVRAVRGRRRRPLDGRASTRRSRRRAGVRGPVPAGARLARVPVPGPAAAAGAAARSAWPGTRRGRVLRPARRRGCARPPTGSSISCLDQLTRIVR